MGPKIALALKGIDYEYKPVSSGQQFSEEYRKINPKSEVPVLQIDGIILTQSLPIIEYLDETRPNMGCSLLPEKPAERALVRRLSELINSGIQPLQNRSVLEHLPANVDKKEWSAYWIDRGFKALEKELELVAGKYCVGDQLTMVDLCLVPQVYNAYKFGVDMSQFPTINRLFSTLDAMEPFRKAAPQNQPDFST